MPSSPEFISLRGVRVRNLRGIDVDIPLGRLTAVTGVSGAGKSSLAFDTLFAEGRRRYVETLSIAARSLLDPISRPEADQIGSIPPAIAVRQRFPEISPRPTVATAAEIHPLLRLLYAQGATLFCPTCSLPIRAYTPAQAADAIHRRPSGARIMAAFPLKSAVVGTRTQGLFAAAAALQKAGFIRAIWNGRTVAPADLAKGDPDPISLDTAAVVVDRLIVGGNRQRLVESLEQAYRQGHGVCWTYSSPEGPESTAGGGPSGDAPRPTVMIDGQAWQFEQWSEMLNCPRCGARHPDPDPQQFSFNQPRSACPECRGLGSGCAVCGGGRLRPESLAWRIAGMSIADLMRQTAADLLQNWEAIVGSLEGGEGRILNQTTEGIERRMRLLCDLGLGYLDLDRPLKSLGAGEAQRVRLVGALATDLVHLLFVLDEPSAGLGACETQSLLHALQAVRDDGNTIVVVENDLGLVAGCDWVVDLGPGAGSDGGEVVYSGPPAELSGAPRSVTGQWLLHWNPAAATPRKAREPSGWLEVCGVQFRNLHIDSVRFPLGTLCVVTGVSGSGKTSLVADVLVPLLRREVSSRSPSDASPPGLSGSLSGGGLVRDVQLVDQGPLGRSPRTTPATFLGLMGQIRQLFAGTQEAQSRNFGPAHFSLYSGGSGRCPTCAGTGATSIDMQFLPELTADCPDCHGARFRPEVLEVRYRGLSIAEVLAQTAREALPFFRGQTKLQRRLKLLTDVGLDSLRLGQPAQSLSAGETQRLRLAETLTRLRGGNCLIVLDEPTRGLHPADVDRLLAGFDHVIAAGHSLIVVEHQPQMIERADWRIELGPGAGIDGGRVVASGPVQSK